MSPPSSAAAAGSSKERCASLKAELEAGEEAKFRKEHCTVDIWEVQRRVTIFHDTWAAPFLPTDGLMRRRWVSQTVTGNGYSLEYVTHPWTKGSEEENALCEVPPLEPRCGWQLDDKGWDVLHVTGFTDSQGWQYGVDLYVQPSLYCTSSFLRHCRRRLWRATFFRFVNHRKPSDPSLEDLLPGPMRRRMSKEFGKPTEESSMITVVEACVKNLDLSAEVEGLFDDRWSNCFILDEFETRGATEIEVGPWLQEVDGNGPGAPRTRTREMSALVPLPPAPMIPKAARFSATYSIHAEKEEGMLLPNVSVKSQYQIHDVPFSEYFTVQERVLLRPMDHDVSISKAFRLEWHRPTWLQSSIESSTLLSEKAVGDHLLRVMRRRALKSRRTCRAEVWEVQRRDSIFDRWQILLSPAELIKTPAKGSSDTSSPSRRRRSSIDFSPQSRRSSSFAAMVFKQRWRWVDGDYLRHPWSCGTWEAMNESEVPPIKHPKGWKLEEPGFEVEMNGLCDSEGWQYASELSGLKSDNPESSWFCYCRRRLWSATFVEPDEQAPLEDLEPEFALDETCCLPCQQVFLQVRRSLRKRFPQLALSRLLLGTGIIWD
mmetsp:Transcript_86535/g.193499  ORF Transcript_86535/g.193499 Transcript_86535/m.193499 type:complete len:600 (-) Transcript_86535:62-1861(-)